MSKEKILDKIKKLMRLASSPEPKEAALALVKAMELMQEHNLTEVDILMSEVQEESSNKSFGYSKKPPVYKSYLTKVIQKAFNVDIYWSYRNGRNLMPVFVGIEASASIAAYCFDVLSRKQDQARKNYLETLHKRTKKSNKTNRANAFTMGWTSAVKTAVEKMIPPGQELPTAVVKYMEQKELVSIPQKYQTQKKLELDALKGIVEGRKVEIHKGVVTRQPVKHIQG